MSDTRQGTVGAATGTVPRPRGDEAAAASTTVDRAVRWWQRSGIQSASGGHHSWFDRTAGSYPFEYSEVTGYQVTLASWLAARGNDVALADAERAVAWLATAVQPVSGGFRCLEAAATVGRFAGKADRLHAFDAGIVLQGLVAHHVATGSAPARTTALDTGEWLLPLVADGVVQPWPATPGVTPWEQVPADWSTRPGVHHAKTGIGLAALGELTGDARYTAAAVAVGGDALGHQLPSGRFVTDPVAGTTNVHPHCYAAEALWAVGTATGRTDLVASPSGPRAGRWPPPTRPGTRRAASGRRTWSATRASTGSPRSCGWPRCTPPRRHWPPVACCAPCCPTRSTPWRNRGPTAGSPSGPARRANRCRTPTCGSPRPRSRPSCSRPATAGAARPWTGATWSETRPGRPARAVRTPVTSGPPGPGRQDPRTARRSGRSPHPCPAPCD